MTTQDKQGLSPSDPRVIIAGIRQFGLASDGSDLRDLEAAIDRLSSTGSAGGTLARQQLIELAFRASINDSANWRTSIARHATGNMEPSTLYKQAEKLADEYLASPPHAAPHAENEVEKALRRLSDAVRSLGQTTKHHETGQPITLFEASPLNDQCAFEAWKELHDAQGQAATALAALRTQQAPASGEIGTTTTSASGERATGDLRWEYDEKRIAQIADKIMQSPISPTGLSAFDYLDDDEGALLTLQIELALSQIIDYCAAREGLRSPVEIPERSLSPSPATAEGDCKPQNLANGQPGATSELSAKLKVISDLPHWPQHLHPDTVKMLQGFIVALAKKLRLSEDKYGYLNGWKDADWEVECREHLYRHMSKGDPRDVAAYCAFMWFHQWSTYPAPVSVAHGNHALQAAESKPTTTATDGTGEKR